MKTICKIDCSDAVLKATVKDVQKQTDTLEDCYHIRR